MHPDYFQLSAGLERALYLHGEKPVAKSVRAIGSV
jgi:hypothetical protein